LKILYYFKEKNTLMDQWQRSHIFDELEHHGCEITVFNPLDHLSEASANENLLKHIQKESYDMFMTPHGSNDLYIDTLKLIRQNGMPTLLICFDNLIVPFNHMDIAKHFDLVWLTSRETENMFKKWGASTIVNPYAANPYFFKPHESEEVSRLAFIGTPYGSRVNMLNTLLEGEVNVSLYSNKPSTSQARQNKTSVSEVIIPVTNLMRFNIGRRVLLGALKQKVSKSSILTWESGYLETQLPVELGELGYLYSQYALSLSSTAARNTGVLKTPVNIVNLRSFEIPMSGGLQICQYFDELAEYFEENKEIIFYRSSEDLIEKAKFYLDDQQITLRRKMKEAARIRSITDHTWSNRFDKVFSYFGLDFDVRHNCLNYNEIY